MKKYFLLIVFISSSFFIFSQNSWTIDSCISYAISHNIQVSQAYLQQDIANAEYTQSKLEYLPSINGSAIQTFSSANSNTNFGIQADVMLYNGNKIGNVIKQKELFAKQKSLIVEDSKLSIIMAVTNAYTQCLYNLESIEISKKILESSKQELEITQYKYDAGVLSAKEFSDIKAQYATNEYNVIKAQNQYNKQLLTLKQLLELPPNNDFTIIKPTIDIESIVIPETSKVYSDALRNFPTIQSAELQSSIDSLQINIAKASYYPYLSASSGISSNITDYSLSPFTQLDNNIYKMFQLKLSVPIFNHNDVKLQVTKAQISSQSNNLQLESTKKELYKDIESMYLQAIASQAEIKSLTQVFESAKTAYELTKELYNVGNTTTTNLLLSQTNYSNSGTSLLQAKYLTLLYYQTLLIYQGKSLSF